jgi:hypothetical protein
LLITLNFNLFDLLSVHCVKFIIYPTYEKLYHPSGLKYFKAEKLYPPSSYIYKPSTLLHQCDI